MDEEEQAGGDENCEYIAGGVVGMTKGLDLMGVLFILDYRWSYEAEMKAVNEAVISAKGG